MHSYHCDKFNVLKFDFPEDGHWQLCASVKVDKYIV